MLSNCEKTEQCLFVGELLSCEKPATTHTTVGVGRGSGRRAAGWAGNTADRETSVHLQSFNKQWTACYSDLFPSCECCDQALCDVC
jgi:hypothetical protein